MKKEEKETKEKKEKQKKAKQGMLNTALPPAERDAERDTRLIVSRIIEQAIPAFIPADYPRCDGVTWFKKHATEAFPSDKFFIFAIQPLRAVSGADGTRIETTSRSFSFFESIAQLREFVFFKPVHHRCFEEVIKPMTPHRFALDMERDDLSEDLVNTYKAFVFAKFLPLLSQFFSGFLGRPVLETDFSVLFACNSSKFSTHICLVDGSYFVDRKQSLYVAYALEIFLYSVDDEDFKSLYVWFEQDKRKCLVDYSVYSSGARNWRTFTAMKIPKKGAPLRSRFADLRPLLPCDRDLDRDWTDFFVTAVEKRNFLIELAAEQVEDIRRQYGQIPINQRSKRNVIRNDPHAAVLPETLPGAALEYGNQWDETRGVLYDPYLYSARLQEAKKKRNDYQRLLVVGQKLARDLATLIHPFNNNGSWQTTRAGELCRLRLSARVFKDTGEPVFRADGQPQRLCYFSYDLHDGPCQQGQHQCDISVLVDLSAVYKCFACKEEGILLPSPFSKTTIRPRFYESGIPKELENHPSERMNYMNYGDLDLTSLRMRPIAALPSGELISNTHSRTIVLHGSMGSGKTYVTRQFINATGLTRICSVTFRVMLAKSNAENFELDFYNSELLPNGCLSEIDKVAIQLDSLERLAEKDDLLRKVVFRRYDLVILDEIESILNHISSKTLENKKNKIFQYLEHLTKYARNVIAADADLGARSNLFIASTRSDSFIEFHRNPFVLKNIQYIDYKFFSAWLNHLMYLVFEQKKNIFVVSNAKKVLFHIEGMINIRLGNSDNDDPFFVKVLSSDMTGHEKEVMAANCKVEWKQYKVLMISPVVGAGISFDEEHYHQCFLYATPFSSVPREVCQLQGRVRNLIDDKVHIFIDESRKYVEKSGNIIALNTKEKQKKLCRLQKDTINVEFDNFDDVTGNIVYRIRDERLMNNICLLNNQEQTNGREKFRSGLIETLQRNNPTLNYRFEKQGDWREEREKLREYENFKKRYNSVVAENVANQLELENFNTAKRRNQKGLLVSDDPEVQDNVTNALIYEETKRVLGVTRQLDEADRELLERYLQLFGIRSNQFGEAVEDFYALHFLTRSQAARIMDNRAIAPNFVEEPDGGLEKARTTAALGSDVLKSTQNDWVQNLFTYCGMEGDLKFHTSLCKERLLNEAAQVYLKENVPIMQSLWHGLSDVAEAPSTAKRYENLGFDVFVTPGMLKNKVNFILQNVIHVGPLEKSVECSEHAKCKVARPHPLKHGVLNLLSLRRSWMLPDNSIYNAKKHLVTSLYPLVPEFDTFNESVSPEDFRNSVLELRIAEEKKFEDSRRRKENVEISKLNEKYESLIAPFVDIDVFQKDDNGFVMSNDEFYDKVFDPAYKTRTKRYMKDCEESMVNKRRRLYDTIDL